MDIIRHEGSISVLELSGALTVVSIFKKEENDDEIVTNVFQCEDCIGFCGSFSIEHYAYRGDPATESGTCYTQPPFQGPCI
jgi:heterodisulfide reductase subunit C